MQQAVVTILNQIYETDFLGFSYGFRPGRGQHDALDALTAAIKRNRVNWVLDLDLSKFFDTIEHDWMLRFVAHRVADKRVLRLLTQWLKVGVLDEHGHRVKSHIGSPQGAVISPLLANIYLHYAFDLWSNKYRKACRGRVSVACYADDVVLGFERKEEAEQFLVAAAERMQRFGLRAYSGEVEQPFRPT
ncbi:reverse transcriptase domain-containing protein [Aeromonas sp. JL9]|uniref:reverse transcriptase domain-containing protein n=1 Tax=Aeromonas sp. JL9 TaxID=2950549 RepID=UPI0021098E73|nr:reverse transcriptase domain-containing protein [Aeromonas sp. JL9]